MSECINLPDNEIDEIFAKVLGYTPIELWVLTDNSGKIYYTGFSQETMVYYKESNGFNDKQIVKLIGEIKND